MEHGLKENSVHSRMNALKFYFEQVLHKEKMFFEIIKGSFATAQNRNIAFEAL